MTSLRHNCLTVMIHAETVKRNTFICNYITVLLAAFSCSNVEKNFTFSHGAIVRGDSTEKKIALVFTGDEFGDGGTLYYEKFWKKKIVRASFFLTGNFYRNKEFGAVIKKLMQDGNYLGSHSDRHLLYCDWTKRDSLLVSKNEFLMTLIIHILKWGNSGLKDPIMHVFSLPPYEWYNDSIAYMDK